MSFKDSGIEWLSHIPSDWEVKKLKYLAEIIDGDRGSEYPNDKDLVDNGILFLSGDNLKSNGFNYSKVRFISEEKFAKLGRGKVLKNDIITSVRGTIGSAGLFSGEVYEQAFINAQMMIIRPRKILDSKFLFYFTKTKAWKLCLDYFAYGTAQQQLSNKILMQLPIAVPGLKIQHQVIKYLDNKINTVDKIIEQKEQLTSMLEQQRQSIITEAVTKGLDPNVKMKDSGVEWIGEIPEHWNIKKVKYLIQEKLSYGANESAELDDENLPRYIRITDIDERGNLKRETFKSLPLEIAQNYIVKKHDILLARSGATVGKSYIHKEDKEASYAGYLIKLRAKNLIVAEYIYYFTNSSIYKQWIHSNLIQATIQNVSAEKYANLSIPISTDENEINSILSHIKCKEAELLKAIDKLKEQISKLKEYRQSLIYEAVTGKIDVRDMELD